MWNSDLISYIVSVGCSGHDVANEEFLYLIQVLIPFKIFMDRDLSIISYLRFRSVCAALQNSLLHISQICVTSERAVGDSDRNIV